MRLLQSLPLTTWVRRRALSGSGMIAEARTGFRRGGPARGRPRTPPGDGLAGRRERPYALRIFSASSLSTSMTYVIPETADASCVSAQMSSREMYEQANFRLPAMS